MELSPSNMNRNKREARSYFEITKSLGVDNPSEILFITDVFEEAVAAKSAGTPMLVPF
jgi:methylthioribulose 1-phosphate dehydratase/enolase-phosphatase E1